jgi:hypothetical protein
MRQITEIALLFVLSVSIARAAPALPPTHWQQSPENETPLPLTASRELATRTFLLGGLGLLVSKGLRPRRVPRVLAAES